MLIAKPIRSQSKKEPPTYSFHSFSFPLNSSFHDFKSIRAFRESIRFSNMPVSRAMVPPETPGITFAAPIAKPFAAMRILLMIFAITSHRII